MNRALLIFLCLTALMVAVSGRVHYQDVNEGKYYVDPNNDGRYYHESGDGRYHHDNSGQYNHDGTGRYAHDGTGRYAHDHSGHYVYDGSGQYVEYAKPTPRPYDEGKLKQWCKDYKDAGLYHYKYAVPDPDDIVAEECAKIFQEEYGEQLRVKGYFKYFGDDGEKYIVDYTADENGFIPDGNNLHPALLAALKYHKTQGKVHQSGVPTPGQAAAASGKRFQVFKGFQPYYFSKNPKIPNPKA
ncbi:larval cuticle protein LCP-30-like [Agrilus planipennis]|uniref:Larval cuticle protein LCP-30-like n=1 Tax=Agrilus planipennis TaxID=224129 RepID=A0A1W4XQW4_AGRPL|nr:larval cuticle protein LCP-30-like [Agrilus planipennis]